MNEETPQFQTEEEKQKPEGNPFAELLPYSFSRKAAANAMGLRYGHLKPETVVQSDDFFRYNGDLGDTIKVLWIRTLPNASEIILPKTARLEERMEIAARWTVQKAERMPEEAYQAAQAWAQSIGIEDDKSEKFYEAYIVFLQTMTEEEQSNFAVTVDNPGPKPPTSEDDSPNA